MARRGSAGSFLKLLSHVEKKLSEEAEVQRQTYEQSLEYDRRRQARMVVADWERFINSFSELHLHGSDGIDWAMLANKQAPRKPWESDTNERLAKQNLDRYEPTFMDRVLRRIPKTLDSLNEKVRIAIERDVVINKANLREWDGEKRKWEDDRKRAKIILKHAPKDYEAEFKKRQPFAGLLPFLCEVSITINEKRHVGIVVQPLPTDALPSDVLALDKGSRPVRKKMTKSARRTLEEGYICSLALRLMWEVYATVPANSCEVAVAGSAAQQGSRKQSEGFLLTVESTRKKFQNTMKKLGDPRRHLLKLKVRGSKAAGF